MIGVIAVSSAILVPMAMAVTLPKSDVQSDKSQLYSCELKMDLVKDGKLFDSLAKSFTADRSGGEKGKVVLERKFAKKNLKIIAWTFNDYKLNFTYELRSSFWGNGISWQTDSPTIQKWEKNGTIHPPQLILPIVIDELDRDIDSGEKVSTHLRCNKFGSAK